MSDSNGTRVSLDLIEALERTHAIDRADRYQRSERGFNTAMRVSSDRPSKLVRLSDGSTPGMFVAFQRVRSDAMTYSQRVAAAQALPNRKVRSQSVWNDIGSTFEEEKRRSRTPDIRHLSISQALGLA